MSWVSWVTFLEHKNPRFNRNPGSFNTYINPVVSQRFSEERELLMLKFSTFVGLGWRK